jgi:hypothetical protein
MLFLYRFLVAIAAAVAVVALYFFVIGIGDGSVSSFNIVLWLVLLGGIGAVLAGGFALNAVGRRRAACALLAILALPGLLSGLFIVSVLILQPRWN